MSQRYRFALLLLSFTLVIASMCSAQSAAKTVQERLGYPAFVAMIGIYVLMVNKPVLWS